MVYYCSKECQKASHKEHKLLCSRLKTNVLFHTEGLNEAMGHIGKSSPGEKVLMLNMPPDSLTSLGKKFNEVIMNPSLESQSNEELNIAKNWKVYKLQVELNVEFKTIIMTEGQHACLHDVDTFKAFMKSIGRKAGVHYWIFPFDFETELQDFNKFVNNPRAFDTRLRQSLLQGNVEQELNDLLMREFGSAEASAEFLRRLIFQT